MGANSKIEWTHHTFNPWWGCEKVSPACQNCYAEAWAKRTGHAVWGKKSPRRFFTEAHWREPYRWNQQAESKQQRKRVFCASMADVFEQRRDLDRWRLKLWQVIEDTPWLDWLLLTKRPQNISRCVNRQDWPDNIWIGTTVENQETANERLPSLLSIPAKIRFLSCEPLLGEIDLSFWINQPEFFSIDWVIAGGESGPKSRPMNPDWVISLRDQCMALRIPFHFKQWGHWAPEYCFPELSAQKLLFDNSTNYLVPIGKHRSGRQLNGEYWDEFPCQLKVK